QAHVASPITDYDASKLDIGKIRLDAAAELGLTVHRTTPGWTVQKSPSGINNVYTYTPGSHAHNDRTARAYQYGFVDVCRQPLASLSGDLGVEGVGNYDDRFWFPLNDEHRSFKDNRHAKIVRGQIKYDTDTVMLRGFEGVPVIGWY